MSKRKSRSSHEKCIMPLSLAITSYWDVLSMHEKSRFTEQFSLICSCVRVLSALSSSQTSVSILSLENHLVCDFRMTEMLHLGVGLPLANAIPSQVLVSIATCGRGRRAWTRAGHTCK